MSHINKLMDKQQGDLVANLEKVKETDDWIMWTTTCQCMSHNLVVEIEYDKEFDIAMFNFYHDVGWSDREDNWFKGLWERIKASSKILFTGYLSLNESFMFRDKQHIEDFQKALSLSIEKINKNNQKSE